jgi:hypothetical protein
MDPCARDQHPLGHHSNAMAPCGQGDECLRSGAFEHYVWSDTGRLTGRVEPLSRCKSAREQQQRLAKEVDDVEHGATPQSMPRGHDGPYVGGIEESKIEARLTFRYGGEVNVASVQSHWQANTAILSKLDLYARMASPKLGEESHDHVLDQLRRGADAEHAGLAGLERARPLADCLNVAQEASPALKQLLALGRQLKAAPDSIEQPYAQFGFQRMELAGGRGLAEIDSGRRATNSASIGNGDKSPQLAQNAGTVGPMLGRARWASSYHVVQHEPSCLFMARACRDVPIDGKAVMRPHRTAISL